MIDAKASRNGAAEIVRDGGGRIVGRTRLQKVAYLLELAGFGGGFRFLFGWPPKEATLSIYLSGRATWVVMYFKCGMHAVTQHKACCRTLLVEVGGV